MSVSNQSLASSDSSILQSLSQRDKYGRLIEDLVLLGIKQNLGGEWRCRVTLDAGPLLAATKLKLTPEFHQLFQTLSTGWKQRTKQTRPAPDPLAFNMLEADLLGTVFEGSVSRLPITTQSFTVTRLGGPLGIMTQGDDSNREITLVCEITSSSDENLLKLKLCKLERLLEYACQEQYQEHDAQPLGALLAAALATEAASKSAELDLEKFLKSNAKALPRLVACQESGRLWFINLPGMCIILKIRGVGVGVSQILIIYIC